MSPEPKGSCPQNVLEDNSVDFIISTGSLHHWKRPLRVFDECFRVLKKR
ncbi:MAG: class I SAM-dependent methyltransferase [Deltaproteobacteria bacterium]|nr:class I SAM-dependent methyltransferase [Deltaproteobacteria bacterium]